MLVLSGWFTGIYYSFTLKRRVEFIESYISFISQMSEIIRFSGITLEEVLKKIHTYGIMEEIIKSVQFGLVCDKSFRKSWCEAVDSQSNILNKSDIEILKDFGSVLGTTDIEGQTAHCTLSVEFAKKNLAAAVEDYKTKSKLYRSLGLLGGVAVALMII